MVRAPSRVKMDRHEHMKTAFSTWNNRIAPVFDVARQVIIVESHEGRIVREAEETMPPDDPGVKARCLADFGVNTLVCGAISRSLHGLISSYGIMLVSFVSGDLREVVGAWLDGSIHDGLFAMPGCCSQPERNGGRGRILHVGRGRCGAGGGPGAGSGGICICPRCSHREPHEQGVPCSRKRCPVCGSPLVRG